MNITTDSVACVMVKVHTSLRPVSSAEKAIAAVCTLYFTPFTLFITVIKVCKSAKCIQSSAVLWPARGEVLL